MNTQYSVWDCIIVGAGISGLAARQRLVLAGKRVLLLEKSRGLGGRTATRRFESSGVADLGAQFASAKTPAFQELLEGAALKEVWLPSDPRHPRWVHPEGMNKITRLLVDGVAGESSTSPILRETRATHVEQKRKGEWAVFTQKGDSYLAKTILLTAPAPQSLELLKQSNIVPSSEQERLFAGCLYSPCIAAVFSAKSNLEPPGILKKVSPEVEGVFDQGAKGVQTAQPKFVVHMTPEFSRQNWNQPDEVLTHQIWGLVGHLCEGSQPIETSLQRWKYCEPLQPLPSAFLRWSRGLPLWLAGDAFLDSRIEGAFESGRAAAQSILLFLAPATALASAWLAERQAIAIYETEIAILRKTAFTHDRRRTLALCLRILDEERLHFDHLRAHFASSLMIRFRLGLSRWTGTAVGMALSLLPSRVSWRAHAWAEKQAAQIYETAHRQCLMPELLVARQQELSHSKLFKEALQL